MSSPLIIPKILPYRTSFYLLLIVVGLFCISCASTKDEPFSKRDIKGAQRVLGLDFTKDELDSMRTWLKRSNSGIKALRTHSLKNELVPRLYFSPLPANFERPSQQYPIKWPKLQKVTVPDNPDDLAFLDVAALSELIRSGEISSMELTQLYINRIRKYDDTLKAVITLTEKLALQQARRADEELAAGTYRGPLHGIPYGIKDLFAVPGYPTTWGAAPYKDQVISHPATIVTKLEEAGAVLIAKLSSGELANGDVWFGGKTKNPWDLSQGASGSSAGSASATAAGLVGFSIGTETWGSIISPSTRCGVTGLRPTYGRVSRFGGMTLSWTLDKVGPICRSALGCAMVFDAIRGEDSLDLSTLDAPFNFTLSQDLRTLKTGYLKLYFDEALEDSTSSSKNNQKALAVFQSLGMKLDSMNLPERFPSSDMMSFIIRSEAGAAFEALVMSNREDELTRKTANSRANSLRVSYFMPATSYIQANRLRGQLIESIDSVFKQYDLILAPTFGTNQSSITNLTGHPVISIPTGWDEKGRPTSISLIGKLYDEATLLAVAHLFQLNTDFDEVWPETFR